MRLSDTGVGDVEIHSSKKERWDALDFDQQQAIRDISETAKAMIDLGYIKAARHIREADMDEQELWACWDQFGSSDRAAIKRMWNK